MSHNVPKFSKPNPLIQRNASLHSLYHPQNTLPFDYHKERDSVSNSKDNSHSHSGIKKLAVLLNPTKEKGSISQDIHNSMSPNYASPKSFLESSSKMNKLRVSTSTQENPNLNLISPKDLVRLAMSKHKSKASLKKVPTPSTTTSSNPRNMRKSHSLRFGPGILGLEKREGSSKLISTSTVDESNVLSRTSLASKDKNGKLRKMKQIYNDMTPTEIARQTRSTMYTPVNDSSGGFLQDSLSPNRSNSGNLLPVSPVTVPGSTTKQGNGNGNNKGKQHADVGHNKEEKGEKSHSSVEQMGVFLKEYKPSMRQAKRQEKKGVQARKMSSTENIKPSSMSFTRLMSHPTLNLGEKNGSPLKGRCRDVMEKDIRILEQSDVLNGKEIKPREEFIVDLKNWVNDIVKPGEEKVLAEVAQQQQQAKKNTGPAEKVKEAQENLLEKLRGALENDEFVRREDYERLYKEKDDIEDELDEVKEENSKLREVIWHMQLEIEKQKSNVLPMNISMSDHEDELLETIARLQKEVEAHKRREHVVKDVIKLIWKAGIQIGDLGFDEDIMEVQEEEEYIKAQQKHKHHGSYEGLQKFYQNNHYNVHENYELEHDDGMHFEIYNKGIPEQKEDIETTERVSRIVKALSELGDSESEPSERNNELNSLPMNLDKEKKAGLERKSHSTGKMKLELPVKGSAVNVTAPKKQVSLPCNKAMDKYNNFILTDEAQTLGFQQEFMSKLEEFSLSWRQAALAQQK